MKKVLCIIIALTMLSLCACGNKSEEKQSNESVNQSSETSSATEIDKIDDDKAVLTGVYQVPMKNIYIDVPNYQAIGSGYSKLYVVGRKMSIAITANRDKAGTTLEQAHKDAFETYVIGYENYAKIDDLSIEQTETIKINDVEVYQFEGKLNCHDETGTYELYTFGYSFIMDGIPCSVEGTVLDRSQPQEMITEIRDTVNAMIKTLRSSK